MLVQSVREQKTMDHVATSPSNGTSIPIMAVVQGSGMEAAKVTGIDSTRRKTARTLVLSLLDKVRFHPTSKLYHDSHRRPSNLN